METRGCLIGRLIIGVVGLLAEASWLPLLTLISQNRAWPHLIALQIRQGAYFHSLLPASSHLVFIPHTLFAPLLFILEPGKEADSARSR